MGLEFGRLFEQVETMGSYLAHRSESAAEKLTLALAWLEAACDLAPVYERIGRVRSSSISGYRGAAPLNVPFGEIVCGVADGPPPPSPVVLVAADGSQVYPNPHGEMLYYLTNISLFTYSAGLPWAPTQETVASLVYSEDKLRDKDHRPINNKTVDARRTLLEVQALAERGTQLGRPADADGQIAPVILIHDGNLLKVFGATQVSDGPRIERHYLQALTQARESGALLAGYVDSPRSANVVSLLHLLSLPDEGVTETALRTSGPLEGLTDTQLFRNYLLPGQRSALLALNSPQNREYKERGGDDLEIAFFYVNVGFEGEAHIARVDVPMWIARNKDQVAQIHGALLAQCAIQGRKHYPYVLTRADELAYVGGQDKAQLDQLIRVAMRRHRLSPEASHKLQTKGLARGQRRQHRLRA